jgi:aconitate hydratase
VERGLSTKPWVKTSLAPGSKVVTEYLRDSGLLPALEALRFHLVGYGCTTCIGNSGPLPDAIGDTISAGKLNVAAVLSGNRNFEGRVHPLVRSNYLASPPLVVAYALAGRVDIDLLNEPIGQDQNGQSVYLKEIWPSHEEIAAAVGAYVKAEQFEREYSDVFQGPAQWRNLQVPKGDQFAWDSKSTYIRKPPYFDAMADPSKPPVNLSGLHALCVLADSITTDHISPAGNIAKDSPAARYLNGEGVANVDFNSYGARRGNHEVMVRGTLANIRIRNAMVEGVEGPHTVHVPTGERMFIYDAAMKYQAAGIGQVILAGKEYGSGSSRDWAAKGVALLGVKAVIAESYERIHRSNLVGMGVLPAQFLDGQNRESLGLTGFETFDIVGIPEAVASQGKTLATVTATAKDGSTKTFHVKVRIDTPVESDYYRNGGILPFVLRQVAAAAVTK